MAGDAPSSMRRDIASAYAASGARVLGWVVISAIVFRRMGAEAFAMLALVRATFGLLSYASVGLAPAMIRLLAVARAPAPALSFDAQPNDLRYAAPARPTPLDVYASGMTLAALLGAAALVAGYAFAFYFRRLFEVPGSVEIETVSLVLAVPLGVVTRIVSDVPGAVLQTSGRIATDNLFQATSELSWAALTAVLTAHDPGLGKVGVAFVASNFLLLMMRGIAAHAVLGAVSFGAARRRWMLPLLSFGSVTVLAQLADFLYAPVDYILINKLLRPVDVATYAPAVQIDAGLLVLVGAIASVLLPKAALAHAAADAARLRDYYVRGTLASAALLAVAGATVWLGAPWLLRLWLGDPMPATQAILPLVLIHTVLGGSSAVGRSILLGMGKVKPFAAAALVSGILNVVLSYCFVKYFNLGLRGIVYGTIVVVTARCAIWMPWYVMRTIRTSDVPPGSEADVERQVPV